MRPKIFLTQLSQYLLMSLIRSHISLKRQNTVIKVPEQTIAKSNEFSVIERHLLIEGFLLTPYISKQLHIFLIILRHTNLINLNILLILHQQFLVVVLESIKVFKNRLHMLQGNISSFLVLLRLPEQRLKGVVSKEGRSKKVLEVLEGHTGFNTWRIIIILCIAIITCLLFSPSLICITRV